MNKNPHSALVVQGGAMRGIFAAGVLDAFIEQQFNSFQFAIGVSAGSTNLIGYLAADHGRSKQILLDHALRAEFINFRRYLRGGHFCDVSWLWQASFQELPLNMDHYRTSKIPLYVVTTSIDTGHGRYFEVSEKNMHQLFPASCAIPLAYREFPEIEGERMTDGGLADAIPVIKAYEMGARDITVILSQPFGFRQRPDRFPKLIKPLLRQNPELLKAVLKRADRYNQALNFIARPPSDCRLHVLAPPPHFTVNRFCRDPIQLEAGYQAGRLASLEHLQRRQEIRIIN